MHTLKIPCKPGEVSDGYHTFDELYDHRCTLFLALMSAHPDLSWMSTKHHDDSEWEGWFIAGMRLPTGDVTYHLPVSMLGLAQNTGCLVLDRGIEWDGHTAADVVTRVQEWIRVKKTGQKADTTTPSTEEHDDNPGLTFGDAWEIQHTVGPSLDHDPKCSSVPGHHPLSGPALLCDCGAIVREWKRRNATDPAPAPSEIPTPRTQEFHRTVKGTPLERYWSAIGKMEELERELADYVAFRKQSAAEWLDQVVNTDKRVSRMKIELAEAREQRDRLEEAFSEWPRLREWMEMDSFIRGYMSSESTAFDAMNKAIAAVKGGDA